MAMGGLYYSNRNAKRLGRTRYIPFGDEGALESGICERNIFIIIGCKTYVNSKK